MPSLTPCTACTAQAALGADQLQYTSASVLDPGIVYIQVWILCGLVWGSARVCADKVLPRADLSLLHVPSLPPASE